jgi:hypothetical protein
MALPESIRALAFCPHLAPDFLDMIEVIGEGGVHVRESDSRNVGDNLIGSQALMLMPRDDVEHADAMAGNTGFAAATPGVLVIRLSVDVDMV